MYRHLLWEGIRPLTMQKGVRATGLKEIQLHPDAWKSLAIKAEVAVRKEGNNANSANPEGLENKFLQSFVFKARNYYLNFVILYITSVLIQYFNPLFNTEPSCSILCSNNNTLPTFGITL